MTREDLDELEKRLMEEVVRRRRLGGYSPDAEGLLMYGEMLLKIIGHLRDKAPRQLGK